MYTNRKDLAGKRLCKSAYVFTNFLKDSNLRVFFPGLQNPSKQEQICY